jgi:hypothetical protein
MFSNNRFTLFRIMPSLLRWIQNVGRSPIISASFESSRDLIQIVGIPRNFPMGDHPDSPHCPALLFLSRAVTQGRGR